jgi:hypothetical protein
LTPIENGFSRIKVHMGKLAARAIDTRHEAAADALETVTPKDCTNFFVHAGYGSHERESARVRRAVRPQHRPASKRFQHASDLNRKQMSPTARWRALMGLRSEECLGRKRNHAP